VVLLQVDLIKAYIFEVCGLLSVWAYTGWP